MQQLIFAVIFAVSASTAMAAEISKISCSFRYEGSLGGKSDVVSCAMTPSEVFSTDRSQQAKSEMCDQKSNAFQENYENYTVDLPAKTVSYLEVMQISDFAKQDWIEAGVARGQTREAATADADQITKRPWSHEVNNVDIGSREIFFKLSGGHYNPPKQMPTYAVRYGESILYYTVGVPEAVIVEPTGDERHTWVNMRFGLCESE